MQPRPTHIGAAALNLQRSFCPYQQPMGASGESQPFGEFANTHYSSLCVFPALRRGSVGPVPDFRTAGSPSHITAPVRGGWPGRLLRLQYVASSLNHNTNSVLPDCIGGSRDLP